MAGSVCLINPPVWSAHAPYLALPLLAGVLREQDIPVTLLDLNAEFVDFALSADALLELRDWVREREPTDEVDDYRLQRARAVFDAAVTNIDPAKRVLRSFEGLRTHGDYRAAQVALRDATCVVSAAFPDLRFELTSKDIEYIAPSTSRVIAAATNPRSLYRWGFAKLLPSRLQDPDLRLVGISITADTQLVAAVTVAAMAKSLRPDLEVVVGGNYATRMAAAWPDEPHPFMSYFDFLITNEGEESLVALYKWRVLGGAPEVPGLLRVERGKVERQAPRTVAIKQSPVPAFDLLPLEKYFSPGPVMPVFASRGCAWKCAFCSIPYASGKFRMRTPIGVVDELEHLWREHGATYFMFVDEIMTIRSLREVALEIARRQLPIYWYAETRFSEKWSEQLATDLYAGGCRRLQFGLETISQRLLDLMNKETKVDYIENNIVACLQAGIAVHLFAIMGFPSETPEEARATREFCERMMTLSGGTYRNPYSSWAISPFTVDIHSPVGQSPESYGITLHSPPADRDLDLTREFSTCGAEDGLSFDDLGAELDSTIGRSDVFTRHARFHMAWSPESEEEQFLRTCLKTGFPHRAERAPRLWIHPSEDAEARLANETTCRHVARSLRSGESGATMILYDGRRGWLAEIPSSTDLSASLARARTVGEFREVFRRACPQDADAMLETCLRFGLVSSLFDSVALSWTAANYAALHSEPTATRHELDSGQTIVVSSVTGAALELSPPTQLLWNALVGGGISRGEMLELRMEPNTNIVDEFFRKALALGLAYASATEHSKEAAPRPGPSTQAVAA